MRRLFKRGQRDFTTRKGHVVRIRDIRASDAAMLADLYRRLSPETRRLRFFGAPPDLPDEILWRDSVRRAQIDPQREAALVAMMRADGRDQIIGVARLAHDDDAGQAAEVGLVVRDDYQGEGLGRALFTHLVDVARARGLKVLRVVTLADNTAMRRLVQTSGLRATSRTSLGETTLTIALEQDSKT